MHLRESAWETIGFLSKWYDVVCHDFIRHYKWNPIVIDSLPVNRLVKIHNDLMDDLERRGNKPDYEDFE